MVNVLEVNKVADMVAEINRQQVNIVHSLIINREGLILTLSILPALQGGIFVGIPAGGMVLVNTLPRSGIGKYHP